MICTIYLCNETVNSGIIFIKFLEEKKGNKILLRQNASSLNEFGLYVIENGMEGGHLVTLWLLIE